MQEIINNILCVFENIINHFDKIKDIVNTNDNVEVLFSSGSDKVKFQKCIDEMTLKNIKSKQLILNNRKVTVTMS